MIYGVDFNSDKIKKYEIKWFFHAVSPVLAVMLDFKCPCCTDGTKYLYCISSTTNFTSYTILFYERETGTPGYYVCPSCLNDFMKSFN